MQKVKTLKLILGDQLNLQHSWLKKPDSSELIVLIEVLSEQEYTTHHIQKICAFFLAMRHFAEMLKKKGFNVFYLSLDDAQNQQSFNQNLIWIAHKTEAEEIVYQYPDEWRVNQHLSQLHKKVKVPVKAVDSEHFLTKRTFLEEFFQGKKTYLMESFYRKVRKDYDLLMDGNQPETGQWNFDASNRKKLPQNHVPQSPLLFNNHVAEVVEMLDKMNVKTIGSCNNLKIHWPINRQQAEETLQYFINHLLPLFGDFQDAMSTQSWSVYHSRLSFALNTKILHPLEVVNAAIDAWRKNPQTIHISQVEGFVRQIIGWREYMRGIYWAKMPKYASLNYFNHAKKLPNWFWNGNTKMNCLKHAIKQSLEHAYAHHIQRLMVIGNFMLLAGIHPNEADNWYLGIYIDALEWVEITNTRGMSQFADGGIVGTKPYVSSATYINKMSNYCATCYYNKDQKTGEKSCPFNSLYWNFYHQHREKLQKNPRIGMMYRVWDKMNNQQQVLAQAESYLQNIEKL